MTSIFASENISHHQKWHGFNVSWLTTKKPFKSNACKLHLDAETFTIKKELRAISWCQLYSHRCRQWWQRGHHENPHVLVRYVCIHHQCTRTASAEQKDTCKWLESSRQICHTNQNKYSKSYVNLLLLIAYIATTVTYFYQITPHGIIHLGKH